MASALNVLASDVHAEMRDAPPPRRPRDHWRVRRCRPRSPSSARKPHAPAPSRPTLTPISRSGRLSATCSPSSLSSPKRSHPPPGCDAHRVQPEASTIGVALSKLRKLGYVERSGNPIRATAEGIEALGPFETLPEGPDLLGYWRNKVGGTERKVLDALVSIYPEPSSQTEMADVTGYSPTASTIGVAMLKLRELELADGWRASDEFMAAIS